MKFNLTLPAIALGALTLAACGGGGSSDDGGDDGGGDTLNQAPTAAFTVRAEGMKAMVDASTSSDDDGTVASYSWDWDNDGTMDVVDATSPTAEYTYMTEGTHTIALMVTDDEGATSTVVTNDVAVSDDGGGDDNEAPELSVTANPTSGTAPLTVSFTASATDADSDTLTYEWDLDGDGTFDPPTDQTTASMTYTAAGTYQATVKVTDGNGGMDTETVPITVNDVGDDNTPPEAQLSATPTSGTAPLTVEFDASASSDADDDTLSYSWDFDNDGTEDASGSDAMVSFEYDTPGTYTATVTVSDGQGGSDTASVDIAVAAPANQLPTFDLQASANSGVVGSTITFTIAGIDLIDGDAVTAVQWNVGSGWEDGTVGENTKDVTFDSEGDFTIQARITDAAGESAGLWTEKSVDVSISGAANNDPVITSLSYSPDPLDEDVEATFVVQANDDADNDPITIAWDFDGVGDYDDRTGASPKWTFAEPGTYTVGVKVSDGKGGVATRTIEVQVRDVDERPMASFTADPESGQAPLTVSFDASGSSDDDEIVSYDWTISADGMDDVTGSGVTFQHTFNDAGSYTVVLTVTDSAEPGQTDTADASITVSSDTGTPPTVTLTPGDDQTIKVGDSISFTADGQDADNDDLEYRWNLGGGFGDWGTDTTQVKQFNNAGTYTVRVRVRDGEFSANDSVDITVVEDQAPNIISLTREGATLEPATITVTAVVEDPDGADSEIVYSWTVNGEAYDSGKGMDSVTLSDLEAGNYKVDLQVEDDYGSTASDSLSFTVQPAVPTVDDLNLSADGLKVTAEIVASDSYGDLATFYWDWDNSGSADDETNASASPQSMDHTFDGANGSRRIAVWVMDDDGNVSSKRRGDITIASKDPVPTFTAEVDKLMVDFDASGTTDPDNNIDDLTFDWDFGDGNTLDDGGTTPSHTYSDDSERTVTLTVTDPHGSSAEYIAKVQPVAPQPPEGNFNFSVDNKEVTFTTTGVSDPDGKDANLTFAWDFENDGTDDSTDQDPVHTFPAGGTYRVKMVITDEDGLTRTLRKNVTVNSDPVADFNFSVDGLMVDFTDQSTDADGDDLTYSWDFKDDGSEDSTDASPQDVELSPAGTYDVTLTVTDSEGNSHSVTKSVTTTDSEPDFSTPPTIGLPDTIDAEGPTVEIDPQFSDDDEGDSMKDATVVLVDDNGNPTNHAITGDEDNDGLPEITFPIKGDYQVKVTVTDQGGNSVEKTITISLNDDTEVFEISGKVEDVVSGEAGAVEGLDVELKWVLDGDKTITIDPSDSNGDFAFGNLMGSVSDFKVLVPKSE